MSARTFTSSRNTTLGLLTVGVIAVALVIVAAFVGVFALSSKAGVPTINVDADNVSIHGYDPVAYFVDGKATKGSADFEYIWQGARWRFANATHRDLFAANPEHYAPRYGGYCSMGLALGEYDGVDPEIWTIVDGKLYLNQGKPAQDLWRKGHDAYIAASEINWREHRAELRVGSNLR